MTGRDEGERGARGGKVKERGAENRERREAMTANRAETEHNRRNEGALVHYSYIMCYIGKLP